MLPLLMLLSCCSVMGAASLRIWNGSSNDIQVSWPGRTKEYPPNYTSWEWLTGGGDKIYMAPVAPQYRSSDFVIPSEVTAEDTHVYCGDRAWWINLYIDGNYVSHLCSWVEHSTGTANTATSIAFCDESGSSANSIETGLYFSCGADECRAKKYAKCPPKISYESKRQQMGGNTFNKILLKPVFFSIPDFNKVAFVGEYKYFKQSWSRALQRANTTGYTLSPIINFKIIDKSTKKIISSVNMKTSGIGTYGKPCINLTPDNVLLHFGVKNTSPFLYKTFCNKVKDAYRLYLFFADGTYSEIVDGKVTERAYNTHDNWFYIAGAPTETDTRQITSVIHWSNQMNYFLFKNGYYSAYLTHPEHAYVVKAIDYFGAPKDGKFFGPFRKYINKITAALMYPNGFIYYFLNDGTYLKEDATTGELIGPNEIVGSNWPGISSEDAQQITAAYATHDGYAILIIKGQRYIKYDIAADAVAKDDSYPKPLPYQLHAQPIGALLWVE